MTHHDDADREHRSQRERPEPAAPHAPHAPLAAMRGAERALAAQRERHQPDHLDVDDDGVGAIVVNTGLDGDAASG